MPFKIVRIVTVETSTVLGSEKNHFMHTHYINVFSHQPSKKKPKNISIRTF